MLPFNLAIKTVWYVGPIISVVYGIVKFGPPLNTYFFNSTLNRCARDIISNNLPEGDFVSAELYLRKLLRLLVSYRRDTRDDFIKPFSVLIKTISENKTEVMNPNYQASIAELNNFITFRIRELITHYDQVARINNVVESILKHPNRFGNPDLIVRASALRAQITECSNRIRIDQTFVTQLSESLEFIANALDSEVAAFTYITEPARELRRLIRIASTEEFRNAGIVGERICNNGERMLNLINQRNESQDNFRNFKLNCRESYNEAEYSFVLSNVLNEYKQSAHNLLRDVTKCLNRQDNRICDCHHQYRLTMIQAKNWIAIIKNNKADQLDQIFVDQFNSATQRLNTNLTNFAESPIIARGAEARERQIGNITQGLEAIQQQLSLPQYLDIAVAPTSANAVASTSQSQNTNPPLAYICLDTNSMLKSFNNPVGCNSLNPLTFAILSVSVLSLIGSQLVEKKSVIKSANNIDLKLLITSFSEFYVYDNRIVQYEYDENFIIDSFIPETNKLK